MNSQNDIFSEELLNDDSKVHLLETAKWSRFLAIVGLIFISLMILGLFMLIAGGGSSFDSAFGMMGYTSVIFLYLIIIALNIYPLLCMYNFNKYMKIGINNNNSNDVATGFKHLKGMFRFMGIITIIIIAFYIIVFLFGALMSI